MAWRHALATGVAGIADGGTNLLFQGSKQLGLEALYVLLVQADGLMMLPKHDTAHQQSDSAAKTYVSTAKGCVKKNRQSR